MKKVIIGLVVALTSLSALAGEGVVTVASTHSAKDTADKFVAIAQEKGLNVFARINHQENATKFDMTLRPTEVIVFGNPKVGTPLMICAQEVALDLPQKVLVYEDDEGKTWLAYNDPMYLKQRHHIEGCDEVLNKISGVLSNLTHAAAKAEADGRQAAQGRQRQPEPVAICRCVHGRRA